MFRILITAPSARVMLYDVCLHELGHLQVVKSHKTDYRSRFASEPKAQEFADRWRERLWAEQFDHSGPARNAPTPEELATVEVGGE